MYSGIGGQAVMEGVMMKNGNRYAVAVRTPDKSIAVTTDETKGDREKINHIPIVRGVVTFVDSLVIGMKSLFKSAEYFEDEENVPGDGESSSKVLKTKKDEAKEKAEMAGTLLFSVVIALALFMALPYGLSKLIGHFWDSYALTALAEGLIRVAIFLIYIVWIGKMEDIHRTYMYHGAEHKCINCLEHGMDLTLENVRKSSRQHKRCGTSFIFIVLIVSIFVFMFIRMPSPVLQLLMRLILVPVIAGISYEFIRLAGRSNSRIVSVLSKPGLALQNLTTAEPDDDMIEVGIASVEAIFDWRKFLEENQGRFEDSCCD